MPYNVTPQSSTIAEKMDGEKLREQAVLASKLFVDYSPQYLYSQAIVATMQGCRASALGMLFVLRTHQDYGTVKRVLDNVSKSDRDVLEKAIAAA